MNDLFSGYLGLLTSKTWNIIDDVMKPQRNRKIIVDPEAEVIALSPTTLLATNRFLCEICGKGFQRDQNLQLHRRGHNLPWKLKQRSGKEPRKRVYVCPEPSCIHHNPARALGDLTGIKKHFCRKHGEKKWKCDKCSKRYAVQSDWKAHSKTCGTREYRCDCGILFSRRDSFITHRAFCDALAEESARVSAAAYTASSVGGNIDYLLQHGLPRPNTLLQQVQHPPSLKPNMIDCGVGQQGGGQAGFSLWMIQGAHIGDPVISYMNRDGFPGYGDFAAGEFASSSLPIDSSTISSAADPTAQTLLGSVPSLFSSLHQRPALAASTDMSATALLQKAAQVGVTSTVPFVGSFEASKYQNVTGDGSKFGGLFLQKHTGNRVDELAVSSRNMMKDCLGGETRDFLGVGVQALCRPPLNGWI
ncbi:zinc finger protein NUTCRACKER-like [Canna indica]|uniref:Protein EARLY HEADING DATE 2 n=1 Tax=Canna indica TaxID=4628 RepID=A0AAQ3K952_9LILI|nr:zinc finger protein NUTCRACKER-like [Canna indica]